MLYDIFNFFSRNISRILKETVTEEEFDFLEEIRIRNHQNIILRFNRSERIIDYKPNSNDILQTLQNICDNSIYSYQKEICEGYITIKGGHRIGITGNCVIENNKVINIRYISSLNFRIAKQIIGCSDNLLHHIINEENNNVFNTLIVSLPGAGKTTLLRDIVRNISNGTEQINGLTVGVVDERGEISAMYKGESQNDVGLRTDVLSNIPKAIGMRMLIRSMAPQVLVADEIGNNEDIMAIREAMCSRNKRNIYSTRRNIKRLILKRTFKTAIGFLYI